MQLKHTRRRHDYEMSYDPVVLARTADSRGLWYETEEETVAARKDAEERALLLRWVRREMRRRLTPRERRFLEQHYFKAFSTREVGRRNGVNQSTVSRTLRQAVAKLRRAARENGRGDTADEAVIRAIKRRHW